MIPWEGIAANATTRCWQKSLCRRSHNSLLMCHKRHIGNRCTHIDGSGWLRVRSSMSMTMMSSSMKRPKEGGSISGIVGSRSEGLVRSIAKRIAGGTGKLSAAPEYSSSTSRPPAAGRTAG